MKQEVPQGWLILKTGDVEDAIKECFESGDPGCFLRYQEDICNPNALRVSAFCRLCRAMTKEIESNLKGKK